MTTKKKRKFAKRSYFDIEKEMIERGKEITKMMRIFSAIKHMIPEGPRKGLERVARSYAERNDDRGSVAKFGQIDFQDDGIRIKNKSVEERTNDRVHKVGI